VVAHNNINQVRCQPPFHTHTQASLVVRLALPNGFMCHLQAHPQNPFCHRLDFTACAGIGGHCSGAALHLLQALCAEQCSHICTDVGAQHSRAQCPSTGSYTMGRPSGHWALCVHSMTVLQAVLQSEWMSHVVALTVCWSLALGCRPASTA
jgi:hypothetical protein